MREKQPRPRGAPSASLNRFQIPVNYRGRGMVNGGNGRRRNGVTIGRSKTTDRTSLSSLPSSPISIFHVRGGPFRRRCFHRFRRTNPTRSADRRTFTQTSGARLTFRSPNIQTPVVFGEIIFLNFPYVNTPGQQFLAARPAVGQSVPTNPNDVISLFYPSFGSPKTKKRSGHARIRYV